jgi:putative heme-binding domain-containing protein
MNRLIYLVALVAACCGGGAAQEGFVPLFNGKDLTGWQGDPALWKVENGEIVGSTHGVKLSQNTFLFHDQEFTDFELRASFRLINGNSGIQFRSERRPDFVAAGYQADLAEKTYTGMLYEERKRGILPYWNEKPEEERARIENEIYKRHDWNDFVIIAQGDQVKLILNGEVTCDLNDPEGAKRGFIALQLHTGPEMEVRFKNIGIKDLSAKPEPQDESMPAPAAAASATTGPATYASERPAEEELLMPDFDANRSEKLGVGGDRFRVPEGFVVEEVASHDLIGSVINMTFDPKGRPALAAEKEGIWLLTDTDGDGVYDAKHNYCNEVSTTMGLYYLGDGDLLVHANGPQGPALYRLLDRDGDDVAEEVVRIQRSDGGMGEHGPHSIVRGPDGYLHIMYGNHAHPLREVDSASPFRDYQEDHLLNRYVDPRGHANNIMAPGGTIQRVHPDLDRNEWHQFCGGFRNAYDFSINLSGEIITFDSDMEWDFGLPWYRPVRVAHCVQGADYGWRTGSSKKPFYYLDTLPSIDDIGRGSPVGTAFYYHYAYPQKYWGAYFMGDWSRGRIRAMFPKKDGATLSGKSLDFVLGEPLNVTDLDVGPDGSLYFTNGGRSTYGGMFRVRYTGEPWKSVEHPVVDQPMPRSAWGQKALLAVKEEWGRARWRRELLEIAADTARPADARLRALEALQIHGPQPRVPELAALLDDGDAVVRAQAVYLLGASEAEVDEALITKALGDADMLVARRASEALVRRIGAGPAQVSPDTVARLLSLLDAKDRFAAYAAMQALRRVDKGLWRDAILTANFEAHPGQTLRGLLALAISAPACEDTKAVMNKLATLPVATMDTAALLDFARVVQLTILRDACDPKDFGVLRNALAPALLDRFPAEDLSENRELQILLAHFQEAAAIQPMLDYLDTPDLAQEEQIHTIYCLRELKEGWSKQQRQQLVAWFDRGREMGGAASMEGFINNLWDSSLALMPGPEQEIAKVRKDRQLKKRREEAMALLALSNPEEAAGAGELAQMSFAEMADYLEYDPMAYREPNLEAGKAVFVKAKCAACHLFGEVGKGGGPDLSSLASRFRRRDILEAIMYPSKVISDQYSAVEVDTKDGAKFLGMLAGETEEQLTIITAYGDRVDIPAVNIAAKKPAEASIMPEGLLNAISLGELVALVQYLEHGAQ